MEAFKPPDYIARLIEAINDGARTAQNGALAFLLVGLYLVATSFSTTDEDLLRESTTSIAQIGVQVPVVVAFAIAPVVFVALHAFTLIRYDMLAVNLRQFRTDLEAMVPFKADRERCRQLLANVEFVQALAAPRGSPLRSVMFHFISWMVVVTVPLLVIGIVEISALRFQSLAVTGVQKGALAADLLLLIWFYYRRMRRSEPNARRAALPLVCHVLLPVWPAWALLSVVLLYGNVPSADETTVANSRHGEVRLAHLWRQPLDYGLCPWLGFGCRYLVVDHRTLLGRVWKDDAITDLRAKGPDLKRPLAAIEGLFLRKRSLLFADFKESRLYGADLGLANMEGADLTSAEMQGADLRGTHLQRATMIRAQLEGARMQGANLSEAQMQAANMSGAQMQGVLLPRAELEAADLSGVQMQGANLTCAHLAVATLKGTRLVGAVLLYAQMQGAALTAAKLWGADLRSAEMQGASLAGAQMQGTDMRGAMLWAATAGLPWSWDEVFTGYTNFAWSDLDGADFSMPTSDSVREGVLAKLDAIPDADWREAARQRLVARAVLAPTGALNLPAGKLYWAFVQRLADPTFARVDQRLYIEDRTDDAANGTLAELLADKVAADDPAAAHQIAQRALRTGQHGQRESLGAALACRLLADVANGKVSFAGYEDDVAKLKKDCTGAKASHWPAG